MDRVSRSLAEARAAVTVARKLLDLLDEERRRWFETRPVNAAGDLDVVRDRRRVEYLDFLDEKRAAAQEALVPLLAARGQHVALARKAHEGLTVGHIDGDVGRLLECFADI